MLDERVVHFDGLSLRPLLLDGGAHAGAVIPTWQKWYARSELHDDCTSAYAIAQELTYFV